MSVEIKINTEFVSSGTFKFTNKIQQKKESSKQVDQYVIPTDTVFWENPLSIIIPNLFLSMTFFQHARLLPL